MGAGSSSSAPWPFADDLIRQQFNNYDGTSWDQVYNPDDKDPINGLFHATNAQGDKCPLPAEILVNVLSYCDMRDMPNIAQVCAKWKSVTTTVTFWHKMMDRYGIPRNVVPNRIKDHLNGWIVMNAACTGLFTSNLLDNPCGEDGVLEGWRRPEDFSHPHPALDTQMIIENPPVGAAMLPEDSSFPDSQSCFATSYVKDELIQEISFKELGLSGAVIQVMGGFVFNFELMTCPRFDCGGQGSIHISFSSKMEKFTLRKSYEMAAGQPWKKWIYGVVAEGGETFTDPYNTIVSLTFNGKDTRFWAGHYGLKFSRFKMTLKPLEELSPPIDYDIGEGLGRLREV